MIPRSQRRWEGEANILKAAAVPVAVYMGGDGMNKHDALVEILARSMEGKTVNGLPLYSSVVKKLDYKVLGYGVGEADIIALARDRPYAVVVEVKTRDSYRARRKAYRQLERDEKYVRQAFGVRRVFKIYAYWNGPKVCTEWVK